MIPTSAAPYSQITFVEAVNFAVPASVPIAFEAASMIAFVGSGWANQD